MRCWRPLRFCYSKWFSAFERATLSKFFSPEFPRVYLAVANLSATHSFSPVYVPHCEARAIQWWRISRGLPVWHPALLNIHPFWSSYCLHLCIYSTVSLPQSYLLKQPRAQGNRGTVLDVSFHWSFRWGSHFSDDAKWMPWTVGTRRWIPAKVKLMNRQEICMFLSYEPSFWVLNHSLLLSLAGIHITDRKKSRKRHLITKNVTITKIQAAQSKATVLMED